MQNWSIAIRALRYSLLSAFVFTLSHYMPPKTVATMRQWLPTVSSWIDAFWVMVAVIIAVLAAYVLLLWRVRFDPRSFTKMTVKIFLLAEIAFAFWLPLWSPGVDGRFWTFIFLTSITALIDGILVDGFSGKSTQDLIFLGEWLDQAILLSAAPVLSAVLSPHVPATIAYLSRALQQGVVSPSDWRYNLVYLVVSIGILLLLYLEKAGRWDGLLSAHVRIALKIPLWAAYLSICIGAAFHPSWQGGPWKAAANVFVMFVFIVLLAVPKRLTNSQNEAQFLSDEPVSTPEQDQFNRTALADTLVDAAESSPKNETFVIALYGTWGSGKTSVMTLARKEASRRGHKTVWLNAWLYNDPEKIVRVFVQEVLRLLREHRLPVGYNTALRTFARILGKLVKTTSKSTSPGAVLGTLLEGVPTTEELSKAKRRVNRLLSYLIGRHRLMVFVDDLDRCSPESVIGTLEFLKEVVDFENCVFVLGVDHQTVTGILEKWYGSRGTEFLHKTVKVSIVLDQIPRERLRKLYSHELRDRLWMTNQETEQAVELLLDVLDGNPRRIKQFLNDLWALRSKYLFSLRWTISPMALICWELLRTAQPNVYSQLRYAPVYERVQKSYGDKTEHLGPGGHTDARWLESLTQILQLDKLPSGELVRLSRIIVTLFNSDQTSELAIVNVPEWVPTQETQVAEYLHLAELLASFRAGETPVHALTYPFVIGSTTSVESIFASVVRWKNTYIWLKQVGADITDWHLQQIVPAVFDNEFFREFVLNVAAYHKYRVLYGDNAMLLRRLIMAELEYTPPQESLVFVRRFMALTGLPLETWNFIMPLSVMTPSPWKEESFQDAVYEATLECMLASLESGERLNIPEDSLVNRLLAFETDIWVKKNVHLRLIAKEAKVPEIAYAVWLQCILEFWGTRVNQFSPVAVRRWLRTVEAGLLVTIASAISALSDVSDDVKLRLSDRVAHLYQATETLAPHETGE